MRMFAFGLKTAILVFTTLSCEKPSDADEGFWIVNQTDGPLTITTDIADLTYGAEAGETVRLSLPNCNTQKLAAVTGSGRVLARLDQSVCPGENWVISGRGDAQIVKRDEDPR